MAAREIVPRLAGAAAFPPAPTLVPLRLESLVRLLGADEPAGRYSEGGRSLLTGAGGAAAILEPDRGAGGPIRARGATMLRARCETSDLTFLAACAAALLAPVAR